MAAWLAAVERTLSGLRVPVNRLWLCAKLACRGGIRRSARRLDRNHLVGMRLAVLVADRDIFPRAERMGAEAVAALVVVGPGWVVVEDPARMLGSARLVHQKADLVVLAFPEPAHAAMLVVASPERHVDMALVVERGDEFVTMALRALRELLGAGKIEPDAFERVRQRGHGNLHSQAGPSICHIMTASGKGAY